MSESSSNSTGDSPSTPRAHSRNLDALAELEEQRAFLLRSIEDLDREHAAGDLDDESYRALGDDYTARAAEVLRRIESGRAGVREATAAATARRRARRRDPRIALFAALAVVVAGASAYLVTTNAGERVAGQGLTGSVRMAGQDPVVMAKLQEGRDNLSKDPLAAIKAFDAVLAKDPQQVEALTYSGWVFRLVARSATDPTAAKQLLTEARGRLDRAVAADPSQPASHAFRGVLRLRDEGDAEGALEDFCALGSELPPEVAGLVGQAKADAEKAAGHGCTGSTAGATTPAAAVTTVA